MPHIDLLPLARRLWRLRLGSVALGNLEQELLAVRRTEADVPGWMIPSIYTNYLRSQDAREMRRVFYHNEVDMLSMVTLTDYLFSIIRQPDTDTNPIDLYSLGKWQADIGLGLEAEKTLKHVVQDDLPLSIYHKALERLALLLKRQNRYEDALPLWMQWAATSENSVDAHIELAKYFEWRVKNIEEAERWTLEALALVKSRHFSQGELIRPDLDHRLSRLQRKLASS
jgi:tetratricopeptide (TPR) repeat protein